MSVVRITLIGNPNSGKTTLFNYYTGARQHVGNYPGITVEKRGGCFTYRDNKVELLDLPGLYSLTAYSEEERIARTEIFSNDTDVTIGVVNASSLERSMYLMVQLREMGIPLVIALNMMDEAKKNGLCFDVEKLSSLFGVPVVPIIAREHKNADVLMEQALALYRDRCSGMETAVQSTTYGHDKGNGIAEPFSISYGVDIDPVLDEITRKCEECGLTIATYPTRWVALKCIENDKEMLALVEKKNATLYQNIMEDVKRLEEHVALTLRTTPEALVADYRYGYIASLLRSGSVFSCTTMDSRLNWTEAVDSIVTHKYVGPIIMLGVLYIVYQITFFLGAIPQGWIEEGFETLKQWCELTLPNGLLKSLILSGIIDGVGGILGFVPLVLFLFLQIAFLEDLGYMARMAYMLDRVFRIFGLHGYSVMPLIISGGIAGGCAIPGILATRTLRSKKEKLATILVTPFMMCGAKLPVFILFVGIFFQHYQAEVLFAITLLAWCFALCTAYVLRKTIIRGDATPFIMELPPYRLPTFFGVWIHALERIWQYIKKAGTVILMAAILLWGAMTFPMLSPQQEAFFDDAIHRIEQTRTDVNTQEVDTQILAIENEKKKMQLEHSFVGSIGRWLEPVTQYMGFTWRINVALLGGVAAKELTVTTLGIAYSLGEVDPEEPVTLAEQISKESVWTYGTIWAFIIFVLLYAPCITTLAVIKQETNSYLWMFFSLTFNTAIAWIFAVLARYCIDMLL